MHFSWPDVIVSVVLIFAFVFVLCFEKQLEYKTELEKIKQGSTRL